MTKKEIILGGNKYPVIFTMRGEWNGGIAKKYTHTYNSVPFGVDQILMICER